MNIGEAIREKRLSKNLSLMDIEKATGISNGSLCRWENGQVVPNINFCITLAKFYDCTLDELVGLSHEPNSYEESTLNPTAIPPQTLSFTKDFGNMFSDKNYIDMSKLYKAISPELRALTLGYIVGILQNNGINTKFILGY